MHAVTQVLPAQYEPTSIPIMYEGYWFRTPYLQGLGDEQWDMRVPGDQLVALGFAVNAAGLLGARRGLLDSVENRRHGEVLRDDPRSFGITGRVTLGVDRPFFYSEPDWGGWSVQLPGVECIDGFQTVGLLAKHSAELSAEHLNLAVLDVRIVTGAARERLRAAHDRAYLHHNRATAQDLLLRVPVIRGLARQFERAGLSFPVRRGESRGPQQEGCSVEEATVALALFSTGPGPELAFRALDPEGREELWGDPSGRGFRVLFNERTQATGVRIAVMLRQEILHEVGKIVRDGSEGHRHLLKDAPDLVVWAVARELPIDRLHLDLKDPAAPNWDAVLKHEVPSLTRLTAERLVEGYRSLRPLRVYRRQEVTELEWWVRILAAAGI